VKSASVPKPVPVRWWGNEPSASATGSSTGFSANFWNWQDGCYETAGEASSDTHAFSFSLDPLQTEFSLDGRPAFRGNFMPGMLAMIPAGQRPWAVQKGAARKLHLYVPRRLMDDAALDVSGARGSKPHITASPVLTDGVAAALCRNVLTALGDVGPGSTMLLEALGLQFAVHALRHWTDLPTSANRYTRPLGKTTVSRVVSYLHENLRRDITLSELAALSDLSVAHFCRAFRQSTGCPPHFYLLGLRIEKAKRMLRATREPISTIAMEAGYDDPSYFARIFKKQVGLAPMAYRRKNYLQ